MMMPGVNYIIYGCFSARRIPGIRSLALEENIVAVITQDKEIDDNLNTKYTTLYTLCKKSVFLQTFISFQCHER